MSIFGAAHALALLCVMLLASSASADVWDDMRERFIDDGEVSSLIFVRVSAARGSRLELLERDGASWKTTLDVPAHIGKNGLGKSREGDGRTPRGVFKIACAFGIAEDPGAKLPYIRATDDLYCCGEGATYNKFIRLSEHPHECRGERIASAGGVYRYALALDYNRDGAPNMGSAIFIHCAGRNGYTAGCVAVEEAAMIELVRSVDASTKVCIVEDGDPLFVLLSDVAPEIMQDIRYHSTYNFVGERINGYEEPVALLTPRAAQALRKVNDELMERGFRLKVFDAYRPQRAVDHFVAWSKDLRDQKMKGIFYPRLSKDRILPDGYVAAKSGHSRGSTVDVTLFDIAAGRDVDMGGAFDLFDEISRSDKRAGLTDAQISARATLRDAMVRGGFRPLASEWWHFTLVDEPWPKSWFDLPVAKSSAGY